MFQLLKGIAPYSNENICNSFQNSKLVLRFHSRVLKIFSIDTKDCVSVYAVRENIENMEKSTDLPGVLGPVPKLKLGHVHENSSFPLVGMQIHIHGKRTPNFLHRHIVSHFPFMCLEMLIVTNFGFPFRYSNTH